MESSHYYQFNKELDLPIFIKVGNKLLNEKISSFILSNQFDSLTEEEAEKKIFNQPQKRILKISEATSVVARQISQVRESDQYGDESIVPANGYRVYRYRNQGFMVFSFGSSEWELGVSPCFATDRCIVESKSIISRFLGLSLSTQGILGLWGNSVDEGIVTLKRVQANGEAVFIDPYNRKIMSSLGVYDIKNNFQIIRLDEKLTGRNILLKREELISYLFVRVTFLDFSGPTASIRQLINEISYFAQGIVHPVESFRSRQDTTV